MSKLIPKYQTPWNKLNYTMPLYSDFLNLMKSLNPLEYKRLLAERAKSKLPHSEVVIDDEGNTVTNVGAGYMSGTDPLGEFVVGNAILNPVFKAIGTGALYGMGRMGNNWARAKLINRAMTPSKAVVPVVKPETSININTKQPKHLLETSNTVPAYFGPKYKMSDVVNPDGTVNIKTALKILQLVAKSHGVPNMLSRPENPKWHKTDPNTFLHTKQTTLRAYNMPTPEGYTKLELVFSALGHDFGKMWAGDGHGQVGAGVLKQMFPNMSDDVYKAIYGHMRPVDLIETTLGKYTRYADIGQNPPKIKYSIDTLFPKNKYVFKQHSSIMQGYPDDHISELWQKFLNNKYIKSNTFTSHIDDEPKYNHLDLGEYLNNNWELFFNNILKPLDKTKIAILPKSKPRLVLSKPDATWKGYFYRPTQQAYVNLKSGNDNTGVHEYISHGTDDYIPNSIKKKWKYLYWNNDVLGNLRHLDTLQKIPWFESRSTFNEGRYDIFKEMQKVFNKKDITLDEYRKYIDNMSDENILKHAFIDSNGQPHNGYAQRLADKYVWRKYMSENNKYRIPGMDKQFVNKLRYFYKYMFGLPGLGLINNKE